MATAASTIDDEKTADAGIKKPSLLSMVLESLSGNKTSKGMTIQGIKKAIIKHYPDTQENFSNKRLQTAIKKGLDSKEIIRPKSSEDEGFKGYFLLNRTLVSQKEKEKEKKKKVTKAASKSDDTEKPKKVKPTKEKKSESTKSAPKPKASKDATKSKKKPLTAKASNDSTKSAKMAAKRRESMSTPKLSRADRTKANATGTKKRLLNNISKLRKASQ